MAQSRRFPFRAVIAGGVGLLVLIAGIFAGPLVLSGPRVTLVEPIDGAQAVNPQAPLRIEFSQAVQADSLATALRFDPALEWDLEVQGGVVLIRPSGGLQYGADYTLTIGAGVRNTLGRASEAEQVIHFQTAPYIALAGFTPADGAVDIALDTPIVVEFANPVVDAAAIAAAADDPRRADALPQPLTLVAGNDPTAISGIGRWLSPTRYGFYPAGGLRAATTYRVGLRADITTDGAARMQRAVSWGFTSAAPLLVDARPFDGQTDVAADRPLEIRLHRDVDPASAGASFVLTDLSGAAIAGTVEQFDEGFRFTPAAPLRRGARYSATIEPGVSTRTGTLLNAEAITWQFSVIGDLAVTYVEPADATRDVPVDIPRISVRFNHPVVPITDIASAGGLPLAATLDPPVAGVGRWIDTSTFIFSPTVALDPATDYRVRVAAGLADQTGGALRSEYSWSFRTIDPAVIAVSPADNYAAPGRAIEVTFNQEMSLSSLRGALTVSREDGAPVSGNLVIRGDTAIFTPDLPLERGVSYTIAVDGAARSAAGDGTLGLPFSSAFRVAPLPALLTTDPAPGVIFAPESGGLTLKFSTPMDWASVSRNLTIVPTPTEVYTSEYEADLYVYFALEPEAEYQLTIGAAARDPYGVTLGQDVTTTLRTGPREPSISLIGPYRAGAYDAAGTTRVPIQWVNVPEISWKVSRLTPEEAARLIATYDAWMSYAPSAEDLVAQATQTLEGERNSFQVGAVDVGDLEPGLYHLELRALGRMIDRQVMAVSPYALTVKRSADQLFVWAVDTATGAPVANLPIAAAAYRYVETGIIDTPQNLGVTGADGVLNVPYDARDTGTIFVWVQDANGVPAFTTTDWESGISPWSFGLPVDYWQRTIAGNIATDKPLYRPGQNVALRGALRGVAAPAAPGQAERYVLPGAGDRAHLLVSDPDGNTIYSTTLTLSPFGTFNTELPLAQGAPLGSYVLVARLSSAQGFSESAPAIYGSFTVAEYRVPAFEVTVTPATPDLLRGDPLNISVQAAYFAGGAPAAAPLRWRLLSAPYYFNSETAPNYSFDNLEDAYDWYMRGETGFFASGDLLADGEGVTDAQGRFTLTLPASTYDRLPSANGAAAGSRVLTLDVEITDVDGQVIAAQGIVTMHAGAFYVGLRPEGYVAQAGQSQQLSIVTVTPQDAPAPGQALDIGIFRREWYSVREQGADGRFYWTSAYTDTLVENLAATTDAQGRASVTFTPPEGGSYRIAASGKDAAGRAVAATAFTWATGGEVFWGIDDSNRVDLIADKRLYRPGETANILVTAPYPDMTALLTIERGNVIEYRTLTLQGTTGLLQVPIRAEYAPNIYASLVLVKAAGDGSSPNAPAVAELRVGLIDLPVSTERQELTVTVTPDKTQVGPRDTITYTVKTTDYTGAGVSAEVALALVDKAILTLADDPNPSLREAFYTRRPLGVLTSNPLTVLVDRVTVRLEAGDKGGGGGEDGESAVRRDFPETAYWNPSLVTGVDGTAQFSVTLPDSLTTWRLSARAITADTRVGDASADIVASKPLLVRPTLPRALTIGDQPVLQAVVQNTTATAIDANVVIEAGAGLTVEGPLEQQISVPANGTILVRWRATVVVPPDDASEVVLTLRASGGGYQDALEASAPLRRLTTAETTASAGQVLDQVVETVTLPADKAADARLELELTPSLVTGVVRGVEQLARTPYLSSEASVSSFMPAAAAYRLLQEAGFDDPQLRATLERSLTNGLQRLYALQHLDGGWGWWGGDKSDPYFSAYALQGLVEARRAGFDVDQATLDRAIAYLEDALDAPPTRFSPLNDPNTRVYVVFVLSEAGKPDRGRAVTLYDDRDRLSVAGKANLLMTLHTAGGEDTRVRTLLAELMGSATLSAADAHWSAGQQPLWALDSDVTTTGLALRALLRVDPQNFLIPNAARWLMGERERDVWRTSYDSAGAVLALVEYAAQTSDLKADYSYRATLDGQTVREGTVTPATLRESSRLIVPGTDLRPDGSQLILQRQATTGQTGLGRLYYTLRLRYTEDAAAAQALDRGFGVQREYIAVASDTLSPTGQLISEARQGDVVQVRITLSVPADVRYLTLEDFLPGGLEALDTSLKTTTAVAREAGLAPEAPSEFGFPYWWYFGHTEVRAGRVALFASDLPKGTYTYTYLARAAVPGTYAAPPATAYRTYAPDVFGRSAGAAFTVVAP